MDFKIITCMTVAKTTMVMITIIMLEIRDKVYDMQERVVEVEREKNN